MGSATAFGSPAGPRSGYVGDTGRRSGESKLAQASAARQGDTLRVAVADDAMIRAFHQNDLVGIVEFSLRAWEPIFASVRDVLGEDLFLRLHPDWKEDQAQAVRSACTTRNGTCSSPWQMGGRSGSSRLPWTRSMNEWA